MSPVSAPAPSPAPAARGGLSPRRLAWRAFRRHRPAMAGLIVVTAFVGVAGAGLALTRGGAPLLDSRQVRLPDKLRPPLAQASPAVPAASRPPGGRYLLGTDDLGRDVLARMVEGALVSLTVGVVAVALAVLIGCLVGGLAGHYGRVRLPLPVGLPLLAGLGLLLGVAIARARGAGWPDVLAWAAIGGLLATTGLWAWRPGRRGRRLDLTVDTLLTGLIDVMLCIPTFFLILTVVAVLRPSIWNIMAVIGLTSWEGTARFVRAEILSLREQEFVQAATALGAGGPRTIGRHLLPNALAPVLVSATLGIAGAILTEAGLSFLGFGVPPPDATWGNIVADGRKYLFDAPWLTLVPGVAIFALVLAFNLLGEGLRDALNPTLRGR